MSTPGPDLNLDPTASSSEFWESLYQSVPPPPTAPRPNVRLEELIHEFAPAPGRACDLGCGRGGDALWLASTGWQVTALDVAATAVAAVNTAADERDLSDRVRAEQHDLAALPPEGPFDLVYACYLHSPVAFDRDDAIRRVAERIATGGRLIVIDHASVAPWSWRLNDDEPRFPSPDETREAVTPSGHWNTERCERAERLATGPDQQTATVADNLITLRRS